MLKNVAKYLFLFFSLLTTNLVQAEQITVAGALRNIGLGWEWINDRGHAPLGVNLRVDTNANHVAIYWENEVSKIHTMTITTDETYAQNGITIGASVNRSFAKLYFYKNGVIVNPSTLTKRWGNFWVSGVLSDC